MPIELNARGHYQVLVIDHVTIIEQELIVFRIRAGYFLTNPPGAFRNYGRLRSYRFFRVKNPGTHQGPGGLVIMLILRFNDSDIELVVFAQQLGGYRDTGICAAYNYDLMCEWHSE